MLRNIPEEQRSLIVLNYVPTQTLLVRIVVCISNRFDWICVMWNAHLYLAPVNKNSVSAIND